MKIKLTLEIIFLILIAMIVNSVVLVEYDSPIDEFYLIKGGAVMEDIVFKINASPTTPSGNIANISLYHNISGTFVVNYTNATPSTTGAETNRIFLNNDTSINSKDLADGLVFVWNGYACDNITNITNEDVSLSPDVFVIYDNNTNTTGHGLCTPSENYTNCITITAGRGQVVHYPVNILGGVMNTTGLEINDACILNGSTNGYFRCNQTRKTYNSSDGLLLTENLITSSVKVNYTLSSTCRFAGLNRTVYVEDAPNITLSSPANASYDTDGEITINFTVKGDSDTYTCQVYSNDTGSWVEESGANIATNNTLKSIPKIFNEGNIIWNVRCSEKTNSNIYGWNLDNYTITVDTTNPAITSSTRAYSNFIDTVDGYSAYINLTVVDNNPDSCHLYINGTLNITDSYTSNTPFAQYFNATDGAYNWRISCNNSAGRTSTTANTSVVIDTNTSGLTRHVNYSSPEAICKGFTVEFNFEEEVNATFTYGLTSMSQTFSEIETDYSTNQTFTLTFNESYETDFYTNITFCDRSSNCNTSISENVINSPVSLCTGWSLWSVYDSLITLLNYRTDSGADFVYFWNNTGQSWIYSTTAGQLNENHTMGIGDVVQVYESTNTTYFRNKTGSPTYDINITGGHVYFGLYHDYKFGNISYNLFLNESGGNFTSNSTYLFGAIGSAGGLKFQIDYLSSFNNSNKQYIDGPYLWSWNNDTTLGKNYKNGLDTLWAYVPHNISINFTPNGFVLGNWT